MIISVHRPASSWFALLVVLFWSFAGAVHVDAAGPLPATPEPHYIRDDARWLTPAEFTALDDKLEAYEQETSSQYVVAIFPRIPPGEELFDFSQRIYEAWKPGVAGKDNGAILLIFADDHKLRIHTGRGMEGVLPDARCQQIIADIIAPKLREGNRAAAVNAGVDAMIAAAKGEYHAPPKSKADDEPSLPIVAFWVIFLLVILYKFSQAYPGAPMRDTIFTILGMSAGADGSSRWGGGDGGGGFSGGGGGFSGGGGDSGGGGSSGSW